MNAVVTANRVAKRIIEGLSGLEHANRTDWDKAASQLQMLDTAVKLAAQRSASVRRHFNLNPSTAASAILGKYGQLLQELERPTGLDGVPSFPDLEQTPY